jgi:hypothetical protein
VIGVPPLDAGAVNATVAVVWPVAVTVPMPGLPGADMPAVVTEAEAADAAEVPNGF